MDESNFLMRFPRYNTLQNCLENYHHRFLKQQVKPIIYNRFVMRCFVVFVLWHYSDVTWVPWRLISPQLHCLSNRLLYPSKHQSSPLLPFYEGNLPVTGGCPHKGASDVESWSLSWRHHKFITDLCNPFTNIRKGFFTGTGSFLRLALCHWGTMGRMGNIIC